MAAKSILLTAALVAAAQSVVAHTIVTSVWVNGEDISDAPSAGTASSYMRVPASNSPVTDLSSALMACNDQGTKSVSGTLTVAAGDTIEPQWWHAGALGSDPIDGSHKGPLTTWISPLDANTDGPVWVEIGSEAYYSSDAEWAVTKMIGNAGRNSITIPATLAPGDYLVRFELLALHSAGTAGGAQFYPNCAQVTVTGSGSQELPAGVSIPGFYTESTPGIVWDIYYSSNYDITGDYVAPGTGTWDGSASYSTDTCETVVDGLAPAGYCQSGSGSTSPSTSKAASSGIASTTNGASTTNATSSAGGASSAVSTSSTVVTTTSKVPVESSRAASTIAATTPPVTSATQASSTAGSQTSSTADPSYTDYNACMRAYNKCLDGAQSKTGGPVDFSSCNSTFQCSALQREKRFRRSVPRQLHGRDRVVRRSH
ncbi:hypothetical protein JCM11641_002875 [Rhodosporidiobolus odoratus]